MKSFKHVSYLWDEQTAATLSGDEVALLVYRSNLLGADLRLTNYGGGNTSCKAWKCSLCFEPSTILTKAFNPFPDGDTQQA